MQQKYPLGAAIDCSLNLRELARESPDSRPLFAQYERNRTKVFFLASMLWNWTQTSKRMEKRASNGLCPDA